MNQEAYYFVFEVDIGVKKQKAIDKNLFFDGYLIGDDEFLLSNATQLESIEPNAITNGTGEFLFIRQKVDEVEGIRVEVSTDLFGFYSAFYHLENSLLTISNSFKALKLHLSKREGIKLNLNIEYLAPLLSSPYTIFSYPYALETALREIKIIPADKVLSISTKGVDLVDKFGSADGATYDELLQKGLISCKKKLLAFNERFKGSFKKLYMSGGKDSRATLAVLLSALSNRDFYLHSNDPRRMSPRIKEHMEQDLKIANKIALLLSLKACDREPDPQLQITPIDFDDSVKNWQNDFSNVRFNFQPAFYAHEYEGSDFKIQFRGAGGEIYRTYWSEVFKGYTNAYKRIQNTKETVRQDAAVIFNALVPSKGMSPEIFDAARDIFIGCMDDMPGECFLQKSDQHYAFLRHRFHFSHGNRGLRLAELMYLPLMDKHFYLASRKLSDSDKSKGKMIFDIVDRLNPYLNLIEYDSSVWSDELLGSSQSLKEATILNLPDFEGGDSHKPALISESIVAQTSIAPPLPKTKTYNRDVAVKNKLISNLKYLHSHPTSRDLMNDDMLEICMERIHKQQNINMLFGKTESIRDAIDEIKINYRVIAEY